MNIKTVITLIFILPILVNCQTVDHTENINQDAENSYFDNKARADIRGVISYDKYQVVVANGNETVSEIAKRLNLDPRKFSMFNGLVESYRPMQGELLALNKKIAPIKKITESTWSQKSTKNVIERVKEKKQLSNLTKGYAKHKVETGETIYSIARLYNASVTSLAKLNKLDAEFTIYVGQNIIVPIAQNKIKPKRDNKKLTSKNVVVNKKNSLESLSNKKNDVIAKNTFIMPVKGKIINEYNPNSGKQKNQGIDIEVTPGSPVLAAASGTVALITDNTQNFGKIILIRHQNNLISIYGRVAKVLVGKNEIVTKGQKIGSMAEKTNDAKNEVILHFELRKGTKSVNPKNYFE